MKPTHSAATSGYKEKKEDVRQVQIAVQQFADIFDRKTSLPDALQRTVEGLSNEFARERAPEELIYDLFKLPNKEEAAVGKLIAVLKSYGIQASDDKWALKKMKTH